MYFNSELFRLHFEEALKKQTLDSVSKEIDVPRFSLSRFQVGQVENETVIDYFKVCKWMNQEPVMYVIDMTKLIPLPQVLSLKKELTDEQTEKMIAEWTSFQKQNQRLPLEVIRHPRPVLSIQVPVSLPVAELVKFSNNPSIKQLEADYYVVITYGAIITSFEFKLLSTESLSDEESQKLRKSISEIYKLLNTPEVNPTEC